MRDSLEEKNKEDEEEEEVPGRATVPQGCGLRWVAAASHTASDGEGKPTTPGPLKKQYLQLVSH